MIANPLGLLGPHLEDSQSAIRRASAELCAGDVVEAERILRAYILRAPTDGDALAKLAQIVLEQGRAEEATMLFQRAVASRPTLDAARLQLARLLDQQGNPSLALAQLENSRGAFKQSAEVRAFKAALLGRLNRHDEEIEIYESLVRDYPRHPGLWMSFGNALKTVGRIKDAVRALRKATQIRSGFGEAWWSLANLKTVALGDHDLRKISQALEGDITEADRVHLHFALAKAMEHKGDIEAAFANYDVGNRLVSKTLSPNQQSVTHFVDAAIERFTPSFLRGRKSDRNQAHDPIFVVGLQRSGSTLIEQILATHNQVEGTSELTLIPQIWMKLASLGHPFEVITRMDPAEISKLGKEYLDRASAFRHTGRPRFIDKLPANWMYVGLIRLILPNAKIIDARRHPMACGFSNFRQLYASGVTFAYSQESIGRFYSDYLRMMNHLKRVDPLGVHRVINEQLIEAPEEEVRKLLDFVGLPFADECLSFYKNERPVNTPSAEQVRRPLNRDGVDSWRPYEVQLGPLKQALGPALHTWDQ